MNKLTAKQKRFVEEYLVDLNATQAAIRAGYSEKTAEQGAAQLLRNIKVAVAIQTAQAERSERTQLTVDMVVERLLLEALRIGHNASQAGRVAAWAHLGKHLGMFVERTINDNFNYVVSNEPLTAEEWSEKYSNPSPEDARQTKH